MSAHASPVPAPSLRGVPPPGVEHQLKSPRRGICLKWLSAAPQRADQSFSWEEQSSPQKGNGMNIKFKGRTGNRRRISGGKFVSSEGQE